MKYSHFYIIMGGHLESSMQVKKILQARLRISYISSQLTSLTHRMWKLEIDTRYVLMGLLVAEIQPLYYKINFVKFIYLSVHIFIYLLNYYLHLKYFKVRPSTSSHLTHQWIRIKTSSTTLQVYINLLSIWKSRQLIQTVLHPSIS